VWEEVIWKDSWGKYQGNSLAGHAIVDGGVLSNFPIELFISDAPQVMKLMGEKTNNTILGMLIDERLEPPAKALVRVNVKLGELATIQRLQRLVDTATGAHDKMVIDEYNHLVVRLPAKGYGTTEFDMSEERRNALVAAGRDAMAAYLDTPAGLTGLVLPSKAMPGGMKPQTPADRIAGSMLSPGPANQGVSP
jgi:predicted acylesterase/phospholipase RssA